ncbi:MAG: primosomal protein N' [Chlamydiales bacterium]|nr:primosomal protein N' [Chlamydiales bacterium]
MESSPATAEKQVKGRQFRRYASIVLDLALDKTLDYGIPENLEAQIRRGTRVAVPVRGHLRYGYVLEIKDHPAFSPVLPIAKAISNEELITDALFDLSLWMARYYCTPLNLVLKTVLPASIRKDVGHKQQLYVIRAKSREELREHCIAVREKYPSRAALLEVMLKVRKGIFLSELLEMAEATRSPVETLVKQGFLNIDIVRVDRSPLIDEEYFLTKRKVLNNEQQDAYGQIVDTLEKHAFGAHLLFGVTGSGKTEVYMQAIEKALEQGRGTIMLVPEISLTPQTIERFRSRFDCYIAVLHHRLSAGERYDEWYKIKHGEAKIVIGARSAIFSPVKDLGLIIVDEEHEQSYKQSDEMPCYNARDVAVMRGKMEEAAVIMGSATPSLESYYNASIGKYKLNRLTARPDAAQIPSVAIVDMKNEYKKAQGYTNFSEQLLDGIKRRLTDGEQTILFLNRRGYHTSLICQGCGKTIQCDHCDVAMTFHKSSNNLSCHLCGYTLTPVPKNCPSCQHSEPMRFKGVGTEQVEKSLHAIFPEIRTLRVDADTTRHKGSHQKLFREFGTGKADVLIGTQMVAKGLHFPLVTLVGVLNSDAALNIPDFRSAETVFQLITQVAGRAGRGVLAGDVVIQTCMPDNQTIIHASKQDYEAFYSEEITTREMFGFPPHATIVKVSFSGEQEERVRSQAQKWHRYIATRLTQEYTLHPVVPAGYARVKNHFRFHFLIRGPKVMPINTAIEGCKKELHTDSKVKTAIDVNPLSTYF